MVAVYLRKSSVQASVARWLSCLVNVALVCFVKDKIRFVIFGASSHTVGTRGHAGRNSCRKSGSCRVVQTRLIRHKRLDRGVHKRRSDKNPSCSICVWRLCGVFMLSM